MDVTDVKVCRGISLMAVWQMQRALPHVDHHRMPEIIPEHEYRIVQEYLDLWAKRLCDSRLPTDITIEDVYERLFAETKSVLSGLPEGLQESVSKAIDVAIEKVIGNTTNLKD